LFTGTLTRTMTAYKLWLYTVPQVQGDFFVDTSKFFACESCIWLKGWSLHASECIINILHVCHIVAYCWRLFSRNLSVVVHEDILGYISWEGLVKSVSSSVVFVSYSLLQLHFVLHRLLKAEAEVRVAQAEFDRQVEVTRLLLEGISSTHVCHRRSLIITYSLHCCC